MKIFFPFIYPRVLVASLVVIALLLLTGFGLPVAQSTPIVSEEEIVTAAFGDSGVVLPGVQYGNAQWGDCNNDFIPDVLITGAISTTARIATVYRQDGAHFFTKVADLTGVINGAAAWGDYNRDGWLDIALTGESSTGLITKIYRNVGNCTFSDIGASPVGVRYSSVAWGDYDNDGQPDLLVTGDNGAGPVTMIYRNVQGVFSDSGVQLRGVKNGTAVWGDYNNDGRLDILLTGAGNLGALTTVYRNDGNGVFTDLQAPPTALNRGAAAWGDYDNDGRLDILLAGTKPAMPTAGVAEIYHNDGNGTFSKKAELIGSNDTWTAAAWADYNHDGLLDVLITTNNLPTVYRNLGSGVFSAVDGGLPWLNYGSAVWGDYDKDGNPDILLSGLSNSSGPVTLVYWQTTRITNKKPNAPAGLWSEWTGSEVRLHWLAATDDITPALTYNLRAGTQPGKIDIIAPLVMTNTRQVPAMGNAFTSLTATVKNLPRGTYYWSVQAIDGAFLGSDFALGSKFVVPYEVYLPLVLKDHMTYFEGPSEVEPNDTYLTANGPLRSGRAYYGIHDDERDYYAVNIATPGTVNVDMTSPSAGTQIQLFYQVADVAHRIGYDPTPPYNLSYSGQAGWYYILVFTDARYLGTQTYTLTVTYQ